MDESRSNSSRVNRSDGCLKHPRVAGMTAVCAVDNQDGPRFEAISIQQ